MLFAAVFVLTGISILAVVNLRRRPYLVMGWLWFLGMLLPVSGLIPFGLQSIADRYTYLPSIGFFVHVHLGNGGICGHRVLLTGSAGFCWSPASSPFCV